MAGTTGLEPAASAVTGQRSNQLNYVPTRQVRCTHPRWKTTARFAGNARIMPDGQEASSWRYAAIAHSNFLILTASPRTRKSYRRTSYGGSAISSAGRRADVPDPFPFHRNTESHPTWRYFFKSWGIHFPIGRAVGFSILRMCPSPVPCCCGSC
jgi:hypothetical protein